MNLLRLLIKASGGLLLLAILAGAASGVCSAALVATINTALGSDGTWRELLPWAFGALVALMALTRIASSILVLRLGQGAVFQLRLHLSRLILRAPLRQLQDLGTARLMAHLTEDINAITEAFTLVPTLCIEAVIVVACLGYLAWLSGPLSAGVLGFALLGVLFFRLADSKGIAAFKTARCHDDALYSHFRALTEGTKELKLHRPRRAAFFAEVLEPTAHSCRRHYTRGVSLYIVAGNLANVLFYVAVGLILFVVPDWQLYSPDTLRGYTLTILYMMMPLTTLIDGLPILGQASVSLDKLEALSGALQADAAPGADRERPVPARPGTRLRLTRVTHRYRRENESGDFALGPLDLELEPGQITFLIGGNGSGKTTLAMILLGLYLPETGSVRLNGRLIDDDNREWYRQHFSAVFSDFFLFDRLLGLPQSDLDARARGYLEKLRLDRTVGIAHGAFSTTSLSQGQRKRLALLTAYLEDRPVYVFDEWASDQDPLFRKVFYTELLPELRARGKTILVITHDDGYFGVADRCIRLEYGRIVTSGEPPAARTREVAVAS